MREHSSLFLSFWQKYPMNEWLKVDRHKTCTRYLQNKAVRQRLRHKIEKGIKSTGKGKLNYILSQESLSLLSISLCLSSWPHLQCTLFTHTTSFYSLLPSILRKPSHVRPTYKCNTFVIEKVSKATGYMTIDHVILSLFPCSFLKLAFPFRVYRG